MINLRGLLAQCTPLPPILQGKSLAGYIIFKYFLPLKFGKIVYMFNVHTSKILNAQ